MALILPLPVTDTSSAFPFLLGWHRHVAYGGMCGDEMEGGLRDRTWRGTGDGFARACPTTTIPRPPAYHLDQLPLPSLLLYLLYFSHESLPPPLFSYLPIIYTITTTTQKYLPPTPLYKRQYYLPTTTTCHLYTFSPQSYFLLNIPTCTHANTTCLPACLFLPATMLPYHHLLPACSHFCHYLFYTTCVDLSAHMTYLLLNTYTCHPAACCACHLYLQCCVVITTTCSGTFTMLPACHSACWGRGQFYCHGKEDLYYIPACLLQPATIPACHCKSDRHLPGLVVFRAFWEGKGRKGTRWRQEKTVEDRTAYPLPHSYLWQQRAPATTPACQAAAACPGNLLHLACPTPYRHLPFTTCACAAGPCKRRRDSLSAPFPCCLACRGVGGRLPPSLSSHDTRGLAACLPAWPCLPTHRRARLLPCNLPYLPGWVLGLVPICHNHVEYPVACGFLRSFTAILFSLWTYFPERLFLPDDVEMVWSEQWRNSDSDSSLLPPKNRDMDCSSWGLGGGSSLPTLQHMPTSPMPAYPP